MKINKIISTLVIGLGISAAAWAVPAKRGPIDVVNEQGEVETIYLHGDEHYHWSSRTEQAECPLSDAELSLRRNHWNNLHAQHMPAQTMTASDLNIAPRGLVILVEFSDLKFRTDADEMIQMINGENYTRDYTYRGEHITCSGSARRYYIDQSMGQYQPEFEVVGPFAMPETMAYYGKNDASGQDDITRIGEMVVEACRQADEAGVDFSRYDNNNDGDIDFVYILYAGEGEADGGGSNTIWPHTFWIKQGGLAYQKFDGKYVDTYACANEIEHATQQHSGIGTFCHEFSHVLGLPDLYVTNNATHKTLGNWDIMDYGPYLNHGNTPPAYSAYERFFLGWLQPVLLSGNENVTVGLLTENNAAGIIVETDTHNMIGNDPNPTTFWMVENRQQKGWDQYIPGHGMLLTKIKYAFTKWNGNTVNNTKSNMGVDIIEADGKATGSYGKAGDAFPNGATQYDGITGHKITNVTEDNGIIRFVLNNGGQDIELDINEQDNDTQVIDIYDIMGRHSTTNAPGMKIRITNHGVQKVL